MLFVEGFAKLAGPLHRLVALLAGSWANHGKKQDRGPAWTPQCEDSFEALKAKLILAPVPAYAYFASPFILELDACHGSLGAVLSQEAEGGVPPVASLCSFKKRNIK